MVALLQLLNPGTEQAVAETVASPDRFIVLLVVWAVVAAIGMALALSRAGVR
jgi:hypothetical protein